MMGAVTSLVLLAAALAMWALNLGFRLAYREELRVRRMRSAVRRSLAFFMEVALAIREAIFRTNDSMHGHEPGETARVFREKP